VHRGRTLAPNRRVAAWTVRIPTTRWPAPPRRCSTTRRPSTRGRVDDFVELFTTDALFYLPDVVGHAAIAQLTTEMLRNYTATSHHISNVRILGREGDEVRATSHVYAWHRTTGGSDVEIWGQYRSRLRFDGGRWRFTRHTARAAGVRPEGAFGDVARVPRRPIDVVDQD